MDGTSSSSGKHHVVTLSFVPTSPKTTPGITVPSQTLRSVARSQTPATTASAPTSSTHMRVARLRLRANLEPSLRPAKARAEPSRSNRSQRFYKSHEDHQGRPRILLQELGGYKARVHWPGAELDTMMPAHSLCPRVSLPPSPSYTATLCTAPGDWTLAVWLRKAKTHPIGS